MRTGVREVALAIGLSRPQSAALPTALAGLAALAISQGIGRFAMTPILPMMQ